MEDQSPGRSIPSRRNALGQPIGEAVPGWTPPPPPSREVMVGRHCRLEPLDPERHAVDLWNAYARDHEHRNWTYLLHGPYERQEDYHQWVQRAASSEDPLFFAVVTAEGATGVAAYLRIALEAGSIEVGHINFSPLLQRTT
jgi:hypothetical protein